MNECLTNATCQKCRQDIDKQLDRAERRLNEHGHQIDELTNISERLTVLLEGQQEQIKDIKDLYKELKDQVTEILLKLAIIFEKDDSKRESQELDTKDKSRVQFWTSPGGLWIIRGGVIIIILLVTAAIGRAIPIEVWNAIFN
jgi:ABC-type Fe3+/spermidine/putrescine transport system ATPase subunit